VNTQDGIGGEVKMVDKNEDQIRRAMEEGQFNNLPGKGKPLDLEENPFEDPEWRAANRMLQNAGFTLPWLENKKSIEADLQEARQQLSRAWKRRQEAILKNRPYSIVESEWQRAVNLFQEKTAEINKRIFSYNLEAPNLQFHKKKIDIEGEIKNIKNHL
jgi:DnaJ homolog subfamily C member 28